MPNPRPVTTAERRRIIGLYRAETEVSEISALTGRSVSVIYRLLDRAGVELRRPPLRERGRAFCEVCNEPVGYVSPARRAAEGIGRFCSQKCMGEAMRLPKGETPFLDCHRCGEIKPVAEFHPHATTARGFQYWCRECCRAERVNRAKVARDPAEIRKDRLKGSYGMTQDDYEAMYLRQGGRCAICGVPKEPYQLSAGLKGRHRFLVVDHDHETAQVRALLCWNCNCGLGQFKENPEFLQAAILYLADQQ